MIPDIRQQQELLWQRCVACEGKGQLSDDPCPFCRTKGEVLIFEGAPVTIEERSDLVPASVLSFGNGHIVVREHIRVAPNFSLPEGRLVLFSRDQDGTYRDAEGSRLLFGLRITI